MTHDFYTLLGSLQSLLYYLYKPASGGGRPEEFFALLATGGLVPNDPLHAGSFGAVREFYFKAAREARSLALSVNDLRNAATELQQHPDFPNHSKRVLAAAAADVSLAAAGSNSWIAAAAAGASATLPNVPGNIGEILAYVTLLRDLMSRGSEFELKLIETALTVEQFCSNLRTGAEGFYRDLKPLVVSVQEFDPELARHLFHTLDQIAECFEIDGSGTGTGVWPSTYISSSGGGGNAP